MEKNLPRTVFWKNSKLKKPLFNVPPILSATGNQIYCPQTQTKIVIDFNIIDPDDSGIDAIYIQISSGYINPQEILYCQEIILILLQLGIKLLGN